MIAFAFTGCSEPKTGPSVAPSSQKPTTVVSPEAGGTTPTASPIEQKAYYGRFVVTEQATSGISTYSQADIDKVIGKTLSFSLDKAVIINDDPSASPVEINNPQYHDSTLAVDDFGRAFKVSAEKLGLSSGNITAIDISDPSGAGGGCTLIMQNNRVIIAAGGEYFVLEQVA